MWQNINTYIENKRKLQVEMGRKIASKIDHNHWPKNKKNNESSHFNKRWSLLLDRSLWKNHNSKHTTADSSSGTDSGEVVSKGVFSSSFDSPSKNEGPINCLFWKDIMIDQFQTFLFNLHRIDVFVNHIVRIVNRLENIGILILKLQIRTNRHQNSFTNNLISMFRIAKQRFSKYSWYTQTSEFDSVSIPKEYILEGLHRYVLKI